MSSLLALLWFLGLPQRGVLQDKTCFVHFLGTWVSADGDGLEVCQRAFGF